MEHSVHETTAAIYRGLVDRCDLDSSDMPFDMAGLLHRRTDELAGDRMATEEITVLREFSVELQRRKIAYRNGPPNRIQRSMAKRALDTLAEKWLRAAKFPAGSSRTPLAASRNLI